MINFNASSYFNKTLIVAGGSIPGGLASVWALSPGGSFVKIEDGHKNNSWDSFTSVAEYVYRVLIWKNMLIVGFGDGPGMAQIWAYKIN